MKKIILMMAFLLSACATENPLKDLRFQPISSGKYTVASWHKITKTGSPVKIYIEGDGHAFDNRGRPTSDPTPEGLFLRKLAVDDTSDNVVYLARPCQYLMGKNCSKTDWTDGRFSSEIIDSMDGAVGALMKKSKSNEMILVGYSGGGFVATQIALRHLDKTKKLITIAGVLNHQEWTDYHKDSPLSASIDFNPKNSELDKINQVHYAGGKDTVVPLELIEAWTPDGTIQIVPKAKHHKGWEKIYGDIWSVR